MSTNVCIIDLPSEVIGFILSYNDISFFHVLKLSMTCKKLNDMINEQNVWRLKYFQKWTLMREVYEDYENIDDTIVCWKKLWQDSFTSIKKLKHLVDSYDARNKRHSKIGMFQSPFTYDYYNELTNLIDTDNGVSPLVAELILRKLKEIANNKQTQFLMETDVSHFRFMMKFRYLDQIIKHMKEIDLTNKWMKVLRLPAEKQTLDKFGMLALEWSDQCPNKYNESNKGQLRIFDGMAEGARIILKKTCPEHPLFSVSKEKVNFWRENVIEDIQWNYIDGRKIVEALRMAMLKPYTEMINLYRERKLQFSTEILAFNFMVEGFARRLGLRCESVIYSEHIFLKWKEYCDTESKSENVYLDFIYGGEFLKETNCPLNGITIGNYQIIEDDQDFEKIQKDMTSLNRLINALMTTTSKAADVKKCMDIYQNMEASYDKGSVLEVAKLKMQAAIIFKSLEKLYMQKGDDRNYLGYKTMSNLLRFFGKLDLSNMKKIKI
ncbi:uncharacterized protein [Prorops nasuta]|uniref:uncharacterized protein n=1 Tax=Prorops nasuta TaxID=863751 RepID=UPI0034CF9E03